MNRGYDFPPYLSRPTTYHRYGDESNSNPSRQLGLDHRSSHPQGYGYGYGEGYTSPSPGNREQLGLDHLSSTHRGYGDRNCFPSPRNGLFGLDHPRPSFQDHNTRFGAPTEHRLSEERVVISPFGQTSISPAEPTPRLRRCPRIVQPQVIIASRRLTPRPPAINQEMINTHATNLSDESKLTKEEQDEVLKKLKKEIYNPMPNKKLMLPPRRVSLYYRDLHHNTSSANLATDPKNKNKDHEEGKRCAVCLEDFEAGDEVMLTPCNHMFHEECIVPWVKNHGQCPICRSVFCERIRENLSELSRENGNRAAALPVDHGLLEGDLLSLIRAVNEAFPWGA